MIRQKRLVFSPVRIRTTRITRESGRNRSRLGTEVEMKWRRSTRTS